jgi:hypothetical protein
MILKFSKQEKPPDDLHKSGTQKYQELFKFIQENAEEGSYLKVDVTGVTLDELEKAIHSMTASVRSWKDRLNTEGYNIEITQTKKILSETTAEVWINVIKFSRPVFRK